MKQRYKEVIDYHINEDTITESSHPVDYSFFKFKELKPVGCEQARITRLGDAPERGKENKKFLTKSIWLNNNKLTSVKGMDTLVNAVLEFPQKLAWIDFSYNYIREIDEIILRFPNLAIVNFHGNKIKDISEVAKLRGLRKLRNITFHGNPIALQSNYRSVIMTYLPTIVHLDFQPVLKSERLAPPAPDALKYLKVLDSLKLKGEDKTSKISRQDESEKKVQKIAEKVATAMSNTSGPKSRLINTMHQPFTSKGPCACVLKQQLLANSQLDN